MAQVILIEDNQTMNDLLSVNLSTYLGVDIIQRKNAEDAINLLTLLPSIDLIITAQEVETEQTAALIAKHLELNSMEMGLIVLGDRNASQYDNAVYVPEKNDWEKVISCTAKLLGINTDAMKSKVMPDYIPVPAKYFLNLDTINCDIFIRIKKSAKEFQYVKRLHNGDSFTNEAIQRYIDNGLDFFYIPKESHKRFAIFLSNKLVEKMDSEDLKSADKIQIMGEAFDIASKEILSLGFDSETVQLTDSIISNMISNFKKSPEMSNLLHKVINSKTGFSYQRSHMLSVVASEIARNMKITGNLTYEKIAFASFFHDILLTQREELAKISSFEELEKAKLSEEEWDLVFNHASEAARLIRDYPEAPLGADELLRHHHGSYLGKGFSNNIDELPMLSKIFIIASQFVLELLLFKEKGGEPKPITEELYKRYPSDGAQLVIKALEETLKNKKK